MEFVYIFIAFVVALLMCRSAKEAFEGMVVQNPFTGLVCMTDDVEGKFNDIPVFRIKTEGAAECLSRNGSSCLMRSDFDIPANARCTTFFGKDGIRNLSGRNKDIFEEFEKGSNPQASYLSCTPDSSKNAAHWCGQVTDTFLKQCQTNVGFKSKYGYTCEDMSRFKAKPNVNKTYNVIDNNQIQITRRQAVQATQAVRGSRVLPPPPPPNASTRVVQPANTGARARRVA